MLKLEDEAFIFKHFWTPVRQKILIRNLYNTCVHRTVTARMFLIDSEHFHAWIRVCCSEPSFLLFW